MTYRFKFAELPAVQWTGSNIQEVSEFVAGCRLEPMKMRYVDLDESGAIFLGEESTQVVHFNLGSDPPTASVRTSDGHWSHAEVGEYIVRLSGQCYGLDKHMFELMFEAVP